MSRRKPIVTLTDNLNSKPGIMVTPRQVEVVYFMGENGIIMPEYALSIRDLTDKLNIDQDRTFSRGIDYSYATVGGIVRELDLKGLSQKCDFPADLRNEFPTTTKLHCLTKEGTDLYLLARSLYK